MARPAGFSGHEEIVPCLQDAGSTQSEQPREALAQPDYGFAGEPSTEHLR
jgi:hypothetical protein